MPRPISWLPRLHEIRRAVASSVRSHYERKDLQQLFGLQPRAAQKLLERLPSVSVGTSRLVEREALASFLERVHQADDASAILHESKPPKLDVSRRRLRSLVQRDTAPVSLDALPAGMTLERGRVEVRFGSSEELAAAMYFLARVLQGEPERFAAEFEPVAPAVERSEDLTALFVELQMRERGVR